jgi:hypothetical protein
MFVVYEQNSAWALGRITRAGGGEHWHFAVTHLQLPRRRRLQAIPQPA